MKNIYKIIIFLILAALVSLLIFVKKGYDSKSVNNEVIIQKIHGTCTNSSQCYTGEKCLAGRCVYSGANGTSSKKPYKKR